MADTTKELETLEEGTSCRVQGRVKIVFDMADGVAKKSGRPWYRQDFILADGQGETKVGWFNPPALDTMKWMEGREVEVQGEVNRYRNKDKEMVTTIKASGEKAVKDLSGESLEQDDETDRKGDAPAPSSGGGSSPRRPRLGTQEVLDWLKGTAPEVGKVVDSLGRPAGEPASADTAMECGQRLLTTLLIQVLDGKLEMESPEEGEDPDVPF